MPAAGKVAAKEEANEPEEEEIYEDASDAGEVFIHLDLCSQLPPMIENPAPRPLFSNISTPHMKPEDYDCTTDWLEYKVYFDQLVELYGWDEERKAMVLGICLKGEARVKPDLEKKLSGTDYCLGTNLLAKRTGLFVPSQIEG